MKRKEFGSDFHFVDDIPTLIGDSMEIWRSGSMYANGRQAIHALIKYNNWKRIWIPVYFCYDIIASIAETGIEIKFYGDTPLTDDSEIIFDISFQQTDVLLRMNYFGLRGWRDSSKLNVTVIEDHSHALTGEWVNNSNADWCIASLRKSLPISEGGVLWSPKGLSLPDLPLQSLENIKLTSERMQAMKLKQRYLKGEAIHKALFRDLFVKTENEFATLPSSLISEEDFRIILSIDVEAWNKRKKENWQILNDALKNDLEILQPEKENCIPFSFVFKGQEYRKKMIDNQIYPAILWQVPQEYNLDLLSVHCDGRYTESDMQTMINRMKVCLK